MPLYEYECINGHKREGFEHHPDDLGCTTMVCDECGHTMAPIPSYGKGLLQFEESKERIIHNLEILGPGNIPSDPVRVASPKDHEKAMKRAGVREPTASDWDKMQLRDRAKKKPGRWV